jgi:hypothetical protein
MATSTGVRVQRPLLSGIAGVGMMVLAACGSAARNGNPTAPSTATVAAVAVTGGSTAAASFQLTAVARMSDGTSRDVTSLAAWESSNPVVAAVSSTGMVTVVGIGELDVRATYQNVSGSMHLSVAVRRVVAVTVSGAPSGSPTFQLTATARGSDGSTQDVSRTAAWESSDTRLASVSPSGYVTILGNGSVDLKATYQGVTGDEQVQVSLPRTFTLSGVVDEVAPNVRPIAGARVQIVGGTHTFSDDRGMFAIQGVSAGRTLLEFSKDGYQTLETEAMVANGDTQITVSLYPAPPR